MAGVNSLSAIAGLIAEPARTAMLITLMDGRALTSGELADAAGVTPQTASGHLVRLFDGGLLRVERQGRHRYYALAGAEVAAMLEGLMSLDATLATARSPKAIVTGPRDAAMRRARMCYNHLAGEIAVAITDAMVARGELELGDDAGAITERGAALLSSLDVEWDRRDRRSAHNASFCRPCLDWSERRPHVAGALGAALCRTFVDRGWLHRIEGSRAMAVSAAGEAAFERLGAPPALSPRPRVS